jgi:hypothetical protein
VQVHYDEGVASHIGPEPCAVFREGRREASVGEDAGWVLSREKTQSGRRPCLTKGKARRRAALSRAACRPGEVRDPMHATKLLAGNREVSGLAALCGPRREGRRGRSR